MTKNVNTICTHVEEVTIMKTHCDLFTSSICYMSFHILQSALDLLKIPTNPDSTQCHAFPTRCHYSLQTLEVVIKKLAYFESALI